MADVTELVTKFKFDGNLSMLKDFNKEASLAVPNAKKLTVVSARLAGVLKKVAAVGLASAAGIVAKGINVQSRSAAQGRRQANKGLSVEGMNRMRSPAIKRGVKNFDQSMDALNDQINRGSLDGNQSLNRLNINIRKANGDVKTSLDVIADLIRNWDTLDKNGRRVLSNQQLAQLLQDIGLDESFIHLITMGVKAYEKLAVASVREAKGLSNEGGEGARDIENSWDGLGNQFSKLLEEIYEDVQPFTSQLIPAISETLANLKDEFKQLIGGVAGAVAALAFFALFYKPLMPLVWLLRGLGIGAKTAVRTTGKATSDAVRKLITGNKDVMGKRAVPRGKNWGNITKRANNPKSIAARAHDANRWGRRWLTPLLNITRPANMAAQLGHNPMGMLTSVGFFSALALALDVLFDKIMKHAAPSIAGIMKPHTLPYMVDNYLGERIKNPVINELREELRKDYEKGGNYPVPNRNMNNLLSPVNHYKPGGNNQVNQTNTVNIHTENPQLAAHVVNKTFKVEVNNVQLMNNAGGV